LDSVRSQSGMTKKGSEPDMRRLNRRCIDVVDIRRVERRGSIVSTAGSDSSFEDRNAYVSDEKSPGVAHGNGKSAGTAQAQQQPVSILRTESLEGKVIPAGQDGVRAGQDGVRVPDGATSTSTLGGGGAKSTSGGGGGEQRLNAHACEDNHDDKFGANVPAMQNFGANVPAMSRRASNGEPCPRPPPLTHVQPLRSSSMESDASNSNGGPKSKSNTDVPSTNSGDQNDSRAHADPHLNVTTPTEQTTVARKDSNALVQVSRSDRVRAAAADVITGTSHAASTFKTDNNNNNSAVSSGANLTFPMTVDGHSATQRSPSYGSSDGSRTPSELIRTPNGSSSREGDDINTIPAKTHSKSRANIDAAQRSPDLSHSMYSPMSTDADDERDATPNDSCDRQTLRNALYTAVDVSDDGRKLTPQEALRRAMIAREQARTKEEGPPSLPANSGAQTHPKESSA
jgi:hypothetical protein